MQSTTENSNGVSNFQQTKAQPEKRPFCNKYGGCHNGKRLDFSGASGDFEPETQPIFTKKRGHSDLICSLSGRCRTRDTRSVRQDAIFNTFEEGSAAFFEESKRPKKQFCNFHGCVTDVSNDQGHNVDTRQNKWFLGKRIFQCRVFGQCEQKRGHAAQSNPLSFSDLMRGPFVNNIKRARSKQKRQYEQEIFTAFFPFTDYDGKRVFCNFNGCVRGKRPIQHEVPPELTLSDDNANTMTEMWEKVKQKLMKSLRV